MNLQREGVQHDAVVKGDGASIFSIADDGEAGVGELSSDLMFAAGEEFDLQELGIGSEFSEGLVLQDSFFGSA